MANIHANQDITMALSFIAKDDTNPVNNVILEKACIAFLRNVYQ